MPAALPRKPRHRPRPSFAISSERSVEASMQSLHAESNDLRGGKQQAEGERERLVASLTKARRRDGAARCEIGSVFACMVPPLHGCCVLPCMHEGHLTQDIPPGSIGSANPM